MSIKNSIPNTVTMMNLLSGVVAIIFAFHPSEEFTLCGSITWLGWQWAGIMIALAAVFDFCDGLVARALHAKSVLGAELDSLSDMVSFGVAPALLLMNTMLETGGGAWSFSALFIPVMGALRLAIFNTDPSQSTTFRGLPIPSNALFWIGFVAAIYGGMQIQANLAALIVLIVGLLMVCRMRMFSLKLSSLSPKKNFLPYLQLVGTILFLILFGVPGLCWAIILYVVLSFLKSSVRITYVEK